MAYPALMLQFYVENTRMVESREVGRKREEGLPAVSSLLLSASSSSCSGCRYSVAVPEV